MNVDMVMVVQIITASTALLAVVVGPFVAYHIATRQIHASVVSVNRPSVDQLVAGLPCGVPRLLR